MTGQMAYGWKPGPPIDIPAAVAAAEIERIRQKYGGYFTIRDGVEESKDEDAVFHHKLEWDDVIGGASNRENQLRHIVGRVVVFNTGPEVPNEPVRAYVSVKTPGEGPRFTTFAYAMSVPNLRQQVLANALQDMRAFMQKYANYAELAGVVSAMEAARETVEKTIKPAE